MFLQVSYNIIIVSTYIILSYLSSNIAFSALTLLVGNQEEHPASLSFTFVVWLTRLSWKRGC